MPVSQPTESLVAILRVERLAVLDLLGRYHCLPKIQLHWLVLGHGPHDGLRFGSGYRSDIHCCVTSN